MSIDPDLDFHGGFAVYEHGRFMGRIYHYTLDNKSFFSAVPDVSPEEFEKLLWSVDENDERVVLIEHLTGTKIPNDRYFIHHLYMNGPFKICPFIWYQKYSKPHKNKTLSHNLMNLPKRIVQAIIYCFRLTHYTRWGKEQLYKKVEANLASQKTAVIDLRRGRYWTRKEEGAPNQYFSYTEVTLEEAQQKPWLFVPLKKEFLTHIESFILALPSDNQSEFYLELLAWIAPEKVEELVIFEPTNLDNFLMYKNIKKLALVDADNLQSLEGLDSFEHLEHIFISSIEDKMNVFDAMKIPDNITIDYVTGYITRESKERFKRWENGSWSSSPSMFWEEMENKNMS